MDHLVYGAPDLAGGAEQLEHLLGVKTSPGGRHLGFGTHNRLLGLGVDAYMEVVAIDPDQPVPERARWFGLDTLDHPRLVTWCARVPDLSAAVERGRDAGIDVGDVREGRRRREDGTLLSWAMTDPWAERAGGVVPFLIDWGETVHPARSLAGPCSCRALRLEHPDPDGVSRWLSALGVTAASALDVEVVGGDGARIVATLDTPRGLVELA